MKKLLLSLAFGCLLLFSFPSCNKGTSKALTYDLKQDESAYVILQLREDKIVLDSFGQSVMVKEVLDEIKSANAKMGFAPLEKKMASTFVSLDDQHLQIMTIRSFDDLSAARIYAKHLDEELKGVKYGSIPEPFAISQSNYKQCMTDKDFGSYYKSYKQSLKD